MTNIQILIVDDYEENLTLYHKFLVGCGYTVEVAVDAASAIEKIKNHTFHIVITDKNMPGIEHEGEGGMDVVDYIHKNCPDTSCIMMTGYATLETAIEAMKAGAIDYLKKPVSPLELKAKIDRIVSYQQALQPQNMISAYKTLKDGMLKAMEFSSQGQGDCEVNDTLDSFSEKLDELFKTIKDREFVLIEQRDALTTIGGLTEQCLELIEEKGKPEELQAFLMSILRESGKRF